MSDYSVTKSGVRMLIECRKPLFSTPDVFEIYSTLQTYPDSTGVPMTELPSTTAIQTSADPSTTDHQTTTVFETSAVVSEQNLPRFSGCQFYETEHGAIFDTGKPYSNDAR